ncbi:MAG: HlyD family secretion protein [Alphaproteobacteria bacterium]|nr:HlyD family secretion protein [Alphaproteobacteria bacterium]MDE1986438.1 HlyD family secretion protein [Alphaproteobacteria bacterium]MDE2163850.1 HlyD family secretion protein [Alphaproteobacteria bacterium]MDE2264608.1 HlyD family secretion protein [Alphaproteobacteria bacterium]MDE2498869.1 HlyD family secretion protein [Alphaproteobacteria bacterium]
MSMVGKKKLLAAGLTLAAVMVLAWVSGGFAAWSGEESTDDAYVQGDITPIAPKVAGYISAVAVGDNAKVRAGAVLFRIDDRDYRDRVSAAKADVTMKLAALTDLAGERGLQLALIAQAKAGVVAAQAQAQRSALDYQRYDRLLKAAAISRQLYDQARAANIQSQAGVAEAQAAVIAAQRKLDVLDAQQSEAQGAVAASQAALRLAQLDLDNTVVRAPVDGVVGNRTIRVGRYVTPGTPVLDVVPLSGVWVVANFEETQLADMKAGQRVRISVDGYSGVSLHGIVDSMAPGSGAAFSLLPPDNATGNFVRIVQRVPVKIRLDADNPLQGRLVPGLSASVSVDVAHAPRQRVAQLQGRDVP